MSTLPALAPHLLNVQQVARQYGITARTVWRWEASGQMPRGLRLTPRTVRWRKQDIEQHIATLAPPSNQPSAAAL
jgi:predicted DNA-binding transcriptional regulator AlpA